MHLKSALAAANQTHLLDFHDSLSPAEQETLTQNISKINLAQVAKIFKTATSVKNTNHSITPIGDEFLASTITSSPEQVGKWRDIGLDLIAKGKVAVILLAGGQGTRLGSSDPKGCYNIKLPSNKSLFQIQGERILKLQNLTKGILVWYVMTSGPTKKATKDFFELKNYFGLDKANVIFFEQGVLPAFTPEGKIILESKTSPAFSPDGNGGIYAALRSEGVLADLKKREIPYIHAYCVDNCLVKVADPVFIGYCVQKGADCGVKSVPKVLPTESVGVICLKDGKPSVVEYSEISKAQSEQRDSAGKLTLNLANIANHFYTTAFLNRIQEFEDKLEYHVAKKAIKYVDSTGTLVTPEGKNGIKLELFIFDILPFSERFVVLETSREDEFSPLKNAPGCVDGDSPDTSRADIIAQHVRYLKNVGGSIGHSDGSEIVFEISPLVSYDGEGLESLNGKVIQNGTLISDIHDV